MKDGRSVLIVEDETISSLYLRRIIEKHYRISGVVRSGEAAVEAALASKPDIVLMDIKLEGDMDGIEAARRIRAARETRVVFCSAYTEELLGDPVGEGLGEAVLGKPIDAGALLDILGKSEDFVDSPLE